MAISVTHTFVSPVADAGDPNEVGPNEWNAAHTITGLGTAAEADSTDFATAAQGALADTAVQPAAIANMLETSDIGVTVQAHSAVLDATTASFLTAHATKLGHISVTQAVDLDAIETAAAASKIKTDFITVTQAVDLDAIETRVNALDAAVVLRGSWDASAGTFPGGGTAQAGDSYIVSVAGTVDSVAFALNDRVIAITDNASTTVFAANWFKADYTDQVLSVDGQTGAVSLSAVYQPLDSDLTAIAALTTQTFGRARLTDTAAEDARNALDTAPYVADRTALKALDTTKDTVAILTEDGREGIFSWRTGNFSTQIAADTQEGLYVKATAIAATAGAWVRQGTWLFAGINALWFGLSASGTAAANAIALQAAADMAEAMFAPLALPAGTYSFDTTLLIDHRTEVRGSGMRLTILSYTGGAAGIKINPASSPVDNNTFYAWRDFSIEHATPGSGTFGVHLELASGEYMSNWIMERVYVGDFGGFGVALDNSIANLDGIFSCQIKNNWITNGLQILKGGDSITVAENTIHGRGIGIYATIVASARKLSIHNNNITTRSESIYLSGTNGVHVMENWCETPYYLGNYTGASGALIYLEDANYTIIKGNTVQPLDEVGGGFVGANYAIDVSANLGSVGNIIDENDLADGVLGHIRIAAANSTRIGARNTFAETALIVEAGATNTIYERDELITTLLADSAGSNVNTVQSVFEAAQDAILLLKDSLYEFEAEYRITRTAGTTSHTTALLFGGTATFDSFDYLAMVTNPTGNVLANVQQIWGAAATAVTITAANTSATENLLIRLNGRLRTNAGGTIIPQFQFSAAPGGAPTIRANSSFRAWKVGSDQMKKIGEVT